MRNSLRDLQYGPVLILKGAHKGRIGYYDDDESGTAIVYPGQVFLSPGWYEIPLPYLRQANTNDMIKRRERIGRQIGLGSKEAIPFKEKYYLLLERHFIDGILNGNIYRIVVWKR